MSRFSGVENGPTDAVATAAVGAASAFSGAMGR
jgi:hypothetical protein